MVLFHISNFVVLLMLASFKALTIKNVAFRQFSQRLRMVNVDGYNFADIEPKWQKYWEEKKTFAAIRRPNHPKKYVLDMFPYPSGSGLHVGHPEGYTATDIMARYWRMQGFDVLHPMGWDSFGLPAEQHAINTGTHPAVTTDQNIAIFKRQLKSLGFSYDWDRELATTDLTYVKWTQWIFLQLFRVGLATQSEVFVNWCPALGTVLANEEIINGLSERGNHPVVRQPLRQWILKITEYADKLESGLQSTQWPEGTMAAQKQWIGRSDGAAIKFEVADSKTDAVIEVFTTRPDTIYGVTYLVVAPESSVVKSLTTPECEAVVQAYIKTVASKSDLERTSTGADRGKTGVWTGSYAIHPFTKEKVPIWIADYVLAGYGTGAVMAVPAHDDRDYEFAKLFQLPITQVVYSDKDFISQNLKDGLLPTQNDKLPLTELGVIFNSAQDMNGKISDDCIDTVINDLIKIDAGSRKINYKLRDWVFSRQRYWGEPIPIFFPVEMTTIDGKGDPRQGDSHRIIYEQPIPVPESELPLRLPEMSDFHPGDDPQGCLARAKDWRYFQQDGKWFARETNTMPQWAGSCWYYLRFADPKNSESLIGAEGQSWLPVDLYVGGQEHAVLHLLYARFWHKVLFDIGVVDHEEPFIKLVHQGMILGSDGEKMSKSRGNVINPDDVVREHGADALRLYEMFMGPLEAVKPWQTAQMAGVVRFRDRVYNLMNRPVTDAPVEGKLLREMNKVIKKVTGDIDTLSFNTAISSLMVYTNSLSSLTEPSIPRQALETLALLVSPFAPHLGEECWGLLGHKNSLALHPWPKFDEALCVDATVVIAIQVNGKTRATVEMENNLPESDASVLAMQQPLVSKYVLNKTVKKIIYVPGKIINFIVI